MAGKDNAVKAEKIEDIQDQNQEFINSHGDDGESQVDKEENGESAGSTESDNGTEEELSTDELLVKALAEKNESHDKMLRMAAELENYKKRMIRERDNALKYAGESLIRDMLPTVDNLERALEHEPEGDVSVFMEGVDMTLKGLLSTLEKAGLTPIKSVGETFDPNLHEAMVMEASKEVPEQCIIREFERGYYYKDRLLRAAKVIVSKGDV